MEARFHQRPQFPVQAVHMARADWSRLRLLPWGDELGAWGARGVAILAARKGESRHEVVFVEAGGRRYAIKETSPEAAAREINAFRRARERGAPTLEPAGWLAVRGEPVEAGQIGGHPVYLSGDTGYCVTRLEERALPQSILYGYPFTEPNKRLLWNAIAGLLFALHEAGVYWGDPSLANTLIHLSGRRLSAVMADAETAEVVNGSLSEGLRQQDLEAFADSLAWQAEDIRQARGLSGDARLITEGDTAYVLSRYAALRAVGAAGHAGARRRWAGAAREARFGRLVEFERRLERLGALGYTVLWRGGRGSRAGSPFPDESGPRTALAEDDLAIAAVRPGWYADRVRALLGVRVPRAAAGAIYRQLNVHKYLLSQRAGLDVGMEAAARDWLETVHAPLMRFLDAYLPGADVTRRYAAYVGILNHTWRMSVSQGRAASIEEGAMDYALAEGARGAPRKPRSS